MVKTITIWNDNPLAFSNKDVAQRKAGTASQINEDDYPYIGNAFSDLEVY